MFTKTMTEEYSFNLIKALLKRREIGEIGEDDE